MTNRRERTERPMPWSILLTPLRRLEQARGWMRILLLSIYAVIGLLITAGIWWSTSLIGLPDIGDPPEVVKLREVTIADDENAYAFYHQAGIAIHPLEIPQDNLFVPITSGVVDWETVHPTYKEWLASNSEALQLWREGAQLTTSIPINSTELDLEITTERSARLRQLIILAILEASRLTADQADLGASWGWYRDSLRSAQHSGMNGAIVYRMIGESMLRRLIIPNVNDWVEDIRNTPASLRVALQDVVDIAAMTPPNSLTLSYEYIALINLIDAYDLDWAIQVDFPGDDWRDRWPSLRVLAFWLNRDDERSRRVARLLFANWLEFCDLPIETRPGFVTTSSEAPRVYETGADDPWRTRVLPPEKLGSWLNSTFQAQLLLTELASGMDFEGRERVQFDALILQIAERLYRLEHDGALPETFDTLVDEGYLDVLPEGYEGMAPVDSAEDLTDASHQGL